MLEVKVGGPYACFTRPEFKAERVSYPMMTPSAARGVLEAIFWKPEIRFEVREIQVLQPVKQTVILRNELSDRQGDTPIFIEERRQQRASLILKDVAYLIRAEMVRCPHASDPLAKYTDQFQRRLTRGQYHHTPYLGTREFAAWCEAPDGSERPVDLEMELGLMLFEIAYCEDRNRREMAFMRHGPHGARRVEGWAEALFFPAKVEHGRLTVPPERYRELYRVEGSDA